MIIDEVLNSPSSTEVISTLLGKCSTFIREANGHPLLKNLPVNYSDFHRVKVRKRNPKLPPSLAEAFNNAFKSHKRNVSQRAIFAYSQSAFTPADPSSGTEPFFVFPPDGFKFLYSKEVNNSSADYQQVIETIFETIGSEKGKDVITEVLKFSYTSENLVEGLSNNCEIIIYNVPFYYAIRVSSVTDYNSLLNLTI